VLERARSWIRRRLADGDGPPAAPPTVPPGTRVYAIGDVHGSVGLLRSLYSLIENDAKSLGPSGARPTLVLLGDYVDRGPDSRGVVDLLLTPPAGFDQHLLMGNHEQALLRFLDEPESGRDWLLQGGAETLASYGVAPGLGSADRLRRMAGALADRMPAPHRTLLRALKPWMAIGDYAFVHAGVEPGVPLEAQTTDALLWIREPFLGSARWHGRMIVHGHTVVPEPEFHPNRIAIDTGAYATGVLTCLVLEGADRRLLRTGGGDRFRG
jgi:serine/threonine protein phosphatase 1